MKNVKTTRKKTLIKRENKEKRKEGNNKKSNTNTNSITSIGIISDNKST